MVSWQPPPMIDHNGLITGYIIQYTRTIMNNVMSMNVNSGTTQYTISELVAFVDYSVRVAAINDNGTGSFSNYVMRTSGQDGKLNSYIVIWTYSSHVLLYTHQTNEWSLYIWYKIIYATFLLL